MTCVTAYDSPELARKSFAHVKPSLGVGRVGDRGSGAEIQVLRYAFCYLGISLGHSQDPPPSF